MSQKGVDYILKPKRGGWTNINPDVAMTLTAKGQSNWSGSFISDTIAYIERPDKIRPTKIVHKDGSVIYYDGNNYYESN